MKCEDGFVYDFSKYVCVKEPKDSTVSEPECPKDLPHFNG